MVPNIEICNKKFWSKKSFWEGEVTSGWTRVAQVLNFGVFGVFDPF